MARSKVAIKADKRAKQEELSAADKLQGQLQQQVEVKTSLEGKKSGGKGSKRHSKLSAKERPSRTTLTSNNEQRNSGGVREGACTRASIPFVVEESRDLNILPGKDSSQNSSGRFKQ